MNIVVIGCSRGIGDAVAKHLEQGKHFVYRVSRNVTPGNFFFGDVTSHSSLKLCSKLIEEKCNHVDALIYCAGVHGYIGDTRNVTPIEWEHTLAVNLSGFLYSVKSFERLLSFSSKRPKVMAFAGGGAAKSRQNFTAYAVSKVGLVRLIEQLSVEQPEKDFNAIAPGAILTDITREIINAGPEIAGTKEYEDAKKLSPDQDSLDKIFKLIQFLLSEESDGISGRLIPAKHPNIRDVDWSDDKMFRIRHIDGR